MACPSGNQQYMVNFIGSPDVSGLKLTIIFFNMYLTALPHIDNFEVSFVPISQAPIKINSKFSLLNLGNQKQKTVLILINPPNMLRLILKKRVKSWKLP